MARQKCQLSRIRVNKIARLFILFLFPLETQAENCKSINYLFVHHSTEWKCFQSPRFIILPIDYISIHSLHSSNKTLQIDAQLQFADLLSEMKIC